MGDTSMLCPDNLDHNVEALHLVHLCSTPRPRNGRLCLLCLSLGNPIFDLSYEFSLHYYILCCLFFCNLDIIAGMLRLPNYGEADSM